MRINGIDRLASRLSSELKEPAPGFLPTIGEWARRYKVCYRTMWKAVKVLKKRGLIVTRKGSSPRRPGRTSDLTTAQQRVYDDFKTDIVEGHYKTGDMLPKYEFLQRTANVSRDTIVAALRMLSTECLVHKKGKKWFAGPSKDRKGPASVSSRSQPVVLLLVGIEWSWEMLFRSNFLRPFIEIFRNELSKHGLQLTVHFSDRPLQAFAAFIPFGQDQAREIVAGLGDRYRGAIAVDFSIKAEEFRTWVRILSCSGQKPVVLFDSSGTHPALVRANLLSIPSYYRLFLDEPSGIELAVKSLLQAGHLTLGVPTFKRHEESWALPRLDLIRSATASISPNARIVHAAHEEEFWVPESSEPHSMLESLAENFRNFIVDPGKTRRSRSGIARGENPFLLRTPSMTSLLASGCTALIALNDWRAQQYLVWFRNAGLRIPEDLSLVSFDNTAESETVPVSTVDFGFARLGYLAAHILIGDIPVRADREGNIAGICALMDRGSIGPPPAIGKI